DGDDTFAVRRGTAFHLKNTLTGGAADQVVHVGRADDTVFVGDWNGDGRDSLMWQVGGEPTFYLVSGWGPGHAEWVFSYGRRGDAVVVGDWDGSGEDTIGVRRGNVYLLRNLMRGGSADLTVAYGRATDEVLVGDWDGDGVDTLGVRRTP